MVKYHEIQCILRSNCANKVCFGVFSVILQSDSAIELVLRVLHLISIHKYLCALTCSSQGSTQRIYQISIWAYKQSFYPVPKLCKIQILVSSCLSINQQFFKKFLSADAHRSLKISNFHKELSLLSLKVLNWSP